MSSSKHFSENDIRVCYDAYLNTCLVRGLEPLEFLRFASVVDSYVDLGWVSKFDSPNKVIGMVTSNYMHKHVFKDLSATSSNIKMGIGRELDKPINAITPNHYGGDTVQRFIEDMKLNFTEGNVVKYVSRHGKKNGLEDLMKAQWYLQRLIDNYNLKSKA